MSGVALLLDENLSEAILGRLAGAFPGSMHVRRELGAGVSDLDIWNAAGERPQPAGRNTHRRCAP